MKVSVAMITYQHEKFVREALDGILMQETDFDFEIVIGEDASNDKTADIIKEYITKHPNKFKVTFHDTNIGMMPNFCNTLNACEGDYIALCEGDDYWINKNKLQKQVDFLEANSEFSGCFHNVMVQDERHAQLESKPWRIYDRDVFKLQDTFSRTALFHTCSFVFRKSALETPKWFMNVKSGDMSLFAIVASKGNLKLLPGNMSVYRKNEGGVTSALRISDYHEGRIALMNYFKGHFGEPYYQYLDDLIKYHSTEMAKTKKGKFKNILKKINQRLK